MKAYIEKLVNVVDRNDEMPEEVEGAINDLLQAIEDDKKVVWYKAPFFKHGQFSKTALFASAANMITLVWYAASAAAGSPIDLFGFQFTLQALDPSLTWAVLGIANGTYIGNNIVKSK